jgi:hypothetical protein
LFLINSPFTHEHFAGHNKMCTNLNDVSLYSFRKKVYEESISSERLNI